MIICRAVSFGLRREVILTLTMALAGCDGFGSNSSEILDEPKEIVRSPVEPPPICTNVNADSNGDGWGWENEQSCKVVNSQPGDLPDLPVGIVYYLWHCITKTSVYEQMYRRDQLPAGEEFNTTNVLAGTQQNWGDENRFHWWDKPAEGYYCLGDEPQIIRKHLAMLRDAGVDFIVVDMTNHPNVKSLAAPDFILKSFTPLLEAAKAVVDSPKIVPWVSLLSENSGTRNELDSVCSHSPGGRNCQELEAARNQSMVEYVGELMLNQYPGQVYVYNDKPLLLEPATEARYPRSEINAVIPQYEQTWTIKGMWGLQSNTDYWQFLSVCQNAEAFYSTNGWSERGCNQKVSAGGEQISVAAGYQYTYISDPFEKREGSFNGYVGGMPKFHGRTLAQQFRVAFDNRDREPVVIVTGWNEWIASRFIREGRNVFVDAYNDERNRDIEPGGSSGDLYYFLLSRLVAHYRAGDPFALEDYFLTRESILDTDYYWDSYPDLQTAFSQSDVAGLTAHWLNDGINEGRRPSMLFDVRFYRQKYGALISLADASAAVLLQHFLDSGFANGYQGSDEFSASAYIRRYDQVRAQFGDSGYYQAFRFFLQHGQSQGHNPGP